MTTAYPHNPTPQQTDPTMRALMEVHRAQVNQLERELAAEKQAHQSSTSSAEFREKNLRDEKARVERDCDRYRRMTQERDEKIADLDQIVERLRDKVQSLQIELQAEREAHAGMRDAASDARARQAADEIRSTPEDQQ